MKTEIKRPQGWQAQGAETNETCGCQNDNPSRPACQCDDVSVYEGITPTPTDVAKWQQILEDIRSDKYLKAIEKVRAVYDKFGWQSPEYRKIKTKLPAITFGGTFSYRIKEKVTLPTGFIIVDIDHLNERFFINRKDC